MEQLAEDFAERAGRMGGVVGRLHLTEDLRFAEDHGIQTARNPEHVTDGVGTGVAVKVRAKCFDRQSLVCGNPREEGFLAGSGGFAVEFGAVASGKDRGAMDIGQGDKIAQSVLDPIAGQYQPFPNSERSGIMVDTECQD